MPAGRPTQYKKEYDIQVYKLSMLGYIDKELAEFFGVSERTLNTWKKTHPKFLQSIQRGKETADQKAVLSVFKRVNGYPYTETQTKVEKVYVDGKEVAGAERVTETITKKRVIPDVKAGMFWLKNRQPKHWRDRQEHEVTGKDGEPIVTIIRGDDAKL